MGYTANPGSIGPWRTLTVHFIIFGSSLSQFRAGSYLHCLSVSASRERQIRPIIVDPGLCLSSRNDIFYATQKRDLPNAYKLFTGEGVLSLIYHYRMTHTVDQEQWWHGPIILLLMSVIWLPEQSMLLWKTTSVVTQKMIALTFLKLSHKYTKGIFRFIIWKFHH